MIQTSEDVLNSTKITMDMRNDKQHQLAQKIENLPVMLTQENPPWQKEKNINYNSAIALLKGG